MESNPKEQLKVQKMNIDERMSKIGKKLPLEVVKGEWGNPL